MWLYHGVRFVGDIIDRPFSTHSFRFHSLIFLCFVCMGKESEGERNSESKSKIEREKAKAKSKAKQTYY